MACAVVEFVFWSLVRHIAGASCFIRLFKPVEVRLGFTVSSYQCREIRVYFYSVMDPVLCVWEELFSYGSLIAPFPFFLPFQCGFFFKFTVKSGLGNSVEDDWNILVAGCFFG